MTARDRIMEVIYAALDEVNEARPPRERVAKLPDVRLIGDGGALDSLALVNLMVSVEERVEREIGVAVSLADALAVPPDSSPFRTPAALADHLASRLP
jgi:acyl carrier protein